VGAARPIKFDGRSMIYICFGMTKSASTFLYQLIEEIFRAAGRRPARLSPPFRPLRSVENYFDTIDPALLLAVSECIGERDVVLKTHQQLHPDVARQIDSRLRLASASIRDPREIALAMVDHGRRARRWGHAEFAECRTVFDALPSIDNQVANFERWSALETLEIFRYNEICFDSAAVVTRIAAQIDVAVDPSEVLAPFHDKGLIGQFNKGAAMRYREMPLGQQSVFLERYAQLYDEFWFDTPAAAMVRQGQQPQRRRGRGQLGHHLAYLRRRLRS
jgi:hypothetical protein